jgi:hypothetical protein
LLISERFQAPAVTATRLTGLGAEGFGQFRIQAGDHLSVNGRVGSGAVWVPGLTVTDTTSVAAFVTLLDLTPSGVYVLSELLTTGEVLLNNLGGEEVLGFSVTISGNQKFNQAMSLHLMPEYGPLLTVPLRAPLQRGDLAADWCNESGYRLQMGDTTCVGAEWRFVLADQQADTLAVDVGLQAVVAGRLGDLAVALDLDEDAVVLDAQGQIVLPAITRSELEIKSLELVVLFENSDFGPAFSPSERRYLFNLVPVPGS